MSFKVDINDQSRGQWWALSGDDTWDGKSIQRPVKTITQALTNVMNLVPPPDFNNLATISEAQGGTQFENIVLEDATQMNFPTTSLLSGDPVTVEVASFQSVNFQAYVNFAVNGKCVMIDGSEQVGVVARSIEVIGDNGIGVDITGTVRDVFVTSSSFDMTGDNVVGVNLTANTQTPTDLNFNSVAFNGDNQTFFIHNPPNIDNLTDLNVSTIYEGVGATNATGVIVQNGTLKAAIGSIEADVAFSVTNGVLGVKGNASRGAINCSGGTLVMDSFSSVNGSMTASGLGELQIRASIVVGDLAVNDTSNAFIQCNRFIGEITKDPGSTLYASIADYSGTMPADDGTIDGIINGVLYGTFNKTVEELDTAELDTSLMLRPDGLGGVEWVAGSGGGVESVTGDGVNNADPANPVLTFPVAVQVDYDNSGSSLSATEVQSAIDGLSSRTDVLFSDKADKDGDSLTNTTVNGVVLDNTGPSGHYLEANGTYTQPTNNEVVNTSTVTGGFTSDALETLDATKIETIQEGLLINVDATDPINPIVGFGLPFEAVSNQTQTVETVNANQSLNNRSYYNLTGGTVFTLPDLSLVYDADYPYTLVVHNATDNLIVLDAFNPDTIQTDAGQVGSRAFHAGETLTLVAAPNYWIIAGAYQSESTVKLEGPANNTTNANFLLNPQTIFNVNRSFGFAQSKITVSYNQSTPTNRACVVGLYVDNVLVGELNSVENKDFRDSAPQTRVFEYIFTAGAHDIELRYGKAYGGGGSTVTVSNPIVLIEPLRT